ncbi:cadherin-like and PC-esterase domain-containing protein 1 isoform X2 [Nothobranchius furzeri]|uniref:cadherin-like and PC-esterase domain-containing protein 1 isoform X2 n=1 Tax=Nothobranchius furzeri TaxID=105023 RepID=UPI003904CAE9
MKMLLPLLLLRTSGMLLRRRVFSGPLLLLLLALLCLYYRTQRWSRSGSEGVPLETRSLISALEAPLSSQVQLSSQKPRYHQKAMVLMGQHLLSDTEVQLYRHVLQQMHFKVHTSRYVETSSFLKAQGGGGWSLLLCLSSSEQSCLRRISFSHLHQHQMVNLLPGLIGAFSDVGGGLCRFSARSQLTELDLPMKPHACGSANQKPHFPQDRSDGHFPSKAPLPVLVAMMNVYILVTSLTPLTSFLHDISVVMTNQDQYGQRMKIRDFLLQQLGPTASLESLGQIKKVIGVVLQAASANEKQESDVRCVLCFQLLTFSLVFNSSITPVVVQVDTKLTFKGLRDTFQRQITRDLILEDTLTILLRPPTHLSPETHLSLKKLMEQYGGCRGTNAVDFLLLFRFNQQLKTSCAFQLLYPTSPYPSPAPCDTSSLLLQISRYYQFPPNSRENGMNKWTNQQPDPSQGACVDPHLRQIYTDPALILTPPFNPKVKEYHTEVNFDTVMVRLHPEPGSAACRVHLDEHRGPRMANFPVGLGSSEISILVTDDAEAWPVVMAIYKVQVYRDSRPSLPMFGDHVTCSFAQDCGLRVRPGLPCGLQPHSSESQSPLQICSSGKAPGRWVVPCLSCSDNRTCDWREVAWQPDNCYHPLVDRPLLQDCLTGRKVLFIGDSTNRGMMYFLMERVNSSLEDWGKAHHTLVYQNLNRGQTQVSYSYYPQFWLEKSQRPTFREALLQLIHRSRPLLNSNQTVLVVGGVQWLNAKHLSTVQEVLDRESLGDILVVVKSLGMGFHLPVDGIRSLSLTQIQNLFRENENIISTAEGLGFEVVDTFGITMGRHKEFLAGRCACHFHEVEKLRSSKQPDSAASTTKWNRTAQTGPKPSSPLTVLHTDQIQRGSHQVRLACRLWDKDCPGPLR